MSEYMRRKSTSCEENLRAAEAALSEAPDEVQEVTTTLGRLTVGFTDRINELQQQLSEALQERDAMRKELEESWHERTDNLKHFQQAMNTADRLMEHNQELEVAAIESDTAHHDRITGLGNQLAAAKETISQLSQTASNWESQWKIADNYSAECDRRINQFHEQVTQQAATISQLREALELCRDYSLEVVNEYRQFTQSNDPEVSTGLARMWAAKRISDAVGKYAGKALTNLPTGEPK